MKTINTDIMLHVYVHSSGDTITAGHLTSAGEEMKAFGGGAGAISPASGEMGD